MSRQPLNVAVIGAGIGGLSADIALRRQGGQNSWIFFQYSVLILPTLRFLRSQGQPVRALRLCWRSGRFVELREEWYNVA